MKTYPIALVNLHQKKCVVIGGGNIALRKVKGLLEADAQTVVISPDLCHKLDEYTKNNEIKVIKREYHSNDLDNAFLVIAATDNPDVNQQVWEDACAKNILVNVVDNPEFCNFIAPAVVRRGPLAISITSGGNSPSLSRRIRQDLEELFGPEYEVYVPLLGEIRDHSYKSIPAEHQKMFWNHLLESDVLALIKKGAPNAARQLAKSILQQYTSMDGS